MITIGQLARYAGVTTKAVRVYHERGLLPEPPRDSSGYRRYRAEDAVELVRIRTLAQAGVPLARIKELLAAGPEEFASALAEIDAGLAERAAEIRRTRARLTELGRGDRLFVSAEVAGYLDRLRQLGASERAVRMERDIWILLHSVAPEQAADWVADKLDALRDPDFGALYIEHDAAFGWSPEDPRLPSLAKRTARWLAGRAGGPGPAVPALDPALLRLVTGSIAGTSPAWDRLASLARDSPG
ncbi:MerR family transcriptional regulator [Nocardia sienata]|uniref:MerR family transcriptional regulator n=1 Tax=Nocardia sienata TaxID=248552 RepID=UPI0007A500B1|nr:MerR family transcriptional regulator [Nocardia sienata]